MSTGTTQVRRLLERQNGHPVISLYLDLDPERFATAPARASQISSLIDEASREIESAHEFAHEDLVALRQDLERVEDFLRSGEAPFKGARALAVFCSSRDGIFEAVPLHKPVPGRVVIDQGAYVEPLLSSLEQRRWLVALVNRRMARLLAGSPDRLRERDHVQDNVHGQHDQGGWSQARYERSVEKDVEDHLRAFAETVTQRWRDERFDRLAIGGPQEIVPRFLELLGEDLRASVAPSRVEVDLSSVTDAELSQALEQVVLEDEQRTERELLDRVGECLGVGRAAQKLPDTVAALNERRVEHLLLEPGFDGQAQRCPSCGLLILEADGACPADGSTLQPVAHLREAVVEAALAQGAAVTVVTHHDDLQRVGGIAALLRF